MSKINHETKNIVKPLFFLLALLFINLNIVSAQTNLPELSIDISCDVYEESTAGNPDKVLFQRGQTIKTRTVTLSIDNAVSVHTDYRHSAHCRMMAQ